MPNGHTSSDAVSNPVKKGGERVRVLLPLALPGPLDYRAVTGPGQGLRPGAFVRVPLGSRERVGVVWDRAPAGHGDGDDDGFDEARLKDVLEVLDAPPMGQVMRRFIDWVAAYTLSPPGAVLRMAMSVPKALLPEAGVTAFLSVPDWKGPEGFRITPQRQKVLDLLAAGPPRTPAEIRAETGAGVGVVKGLHTAGALALHALAPPSPRLISCVTRCGRKHFR
jgi:primosomal protein N' (replication factor Y)